MNDEKYIGLDVHQATISAAVMDQTGKIIMECIVETKAATILELFAGLRGTLAVTFEEGTSAAWLYALLRPHVARVVVCNPRKNALLKQGNKNDSIDARKLAELLRGNYLKSVYHGENGVRTLRELARSYLTTSKDLTRVMSRLKAVYRSWAIPCAGKRRLLQAPAQAVAGKDPASRGTPARRTSLRGIGPAETIATTSAARTIDREPAAYDHRQIKTDPFCGSDSLGLAGGLDPNASSFSYQATVVGYSGLALETRISAEYCYVEGQLRRSKKLVSIRGLNKDHNHDLKGLFKAAALTASARPGPLQNFYQAALAKGIQPPMARLTLARKIAAITLTVWKKGENFDPEKLKLQAA